LRHDDNQASDPHRGIMAERLSAEGALALHTTQAAFASHRENEIGSLEPGKLAD
jgi:predicted amidohydrolase YtcJ